MKIVILLGAPGSGKGTMAARLVSQDSVYQHLSSGDMLRDAVSNHTPAGKLAEGAMKRGELVSDEVMTEMIKEYIAGVEGECTLLLDGFPRTVAQAQGLDRMITSNGAELQAAVLMDVEEELLIRRLAGRRVCANCGVIYHALTLRPEKDGICDLCGSELITRKDDNPETVRTRLAVYREQTMPVIDFYSERGLLRRVVALDELSENVARVKQVLES